LDTIKTSDSTPGASGNYRENTSDFVKSGAGEGEISGAQCVVTGSIQGNRSASLTLPSKPSGNLGSGLSATVEER
jgi:hypothetical protein